MKIGILCAGDRASAMTADFVARMLKILKEECP